MRKRIEHFLIENAILLVFLISLGFGAARVMGEVGDTYKAFAHVWVGIMLGVGLLRNRLPQVDLKTIARACWLLGWILNFVEVIAALPKITAVLQERFPF